jgi:penicillin-insensitive murein endopeptidase
MLHRGAQRVQRRYPGSVLLVGDLSKQDGGNIEGHASHASGRDADVAFYYVDRQGKSIRTERLLRVDASGRVIDAPTLRFDEQRNWALIESFLTDPEVVVQNIFIADSISRRLLKHAREHASPDKMLLRAQAAFREPRRGPVHDDHFHVRIACPTDQLGVCVPEPTLERPSRLSGSVASKP